MNKIWTYISIAAFAILSCSYIWIAITVVQKLEAYNFQELSNKMKDQDLGSNLSQPEAVRLLLEGHQVALGFWRECYSLTWDLLELGVINIIFVGLLLSSLRKGYQKLG
jgi:hypothetical protein